MTMKKPNVFIIGAPKCGTTSVSEWLSSHPAVFFSSIKEPHYFNIDGLRSIRSKAQYEALFTDAGDGVTVIAEGSTHYIYSKEAIRQILKYQPEAKFVVCLRSPVEMAQALHAERIYQGIESITCFQQAWQVRTDIACKRVLRYNTETDPARLWYGEHCLLGRYVDYIYRILGRRKVNIVFLDDIRSDPRKEYLKLLAFLSLDDDGRLKFSASNARKTSKFPRIYQIIFQLVRLKESLGITYRFNVLSKLRATITQSGSRAKISDALHADLCKYFEEDIRLLERLVNRDLSCWLD